MIYVPRIELRHAVGLLVLLHRKLRVTHLHRSRGCDCSHSWLPHHAGWIHVADEWVRSPVAVSGLSRGLHGEEAEALM
jgi:hypothetical protein